MKNIFESGLKLFDGIIYSSITKYPSFTHIKSIFSDEWYNFIVPCVDPKLLDWDHANRIIESQKAEGVSMSYYVPDSLSNLYQQYFSSVEIHDCVSSDLYICKKIENSYSPTGNLVLLDDTTVDTYASMAKICFPEWANNEEYAKHMYEQQKNSKTHIVKNYLLHHENTIVGFCSLIAKEKENLSYFHNTGVLPEFRRKGHFTNMIQNLMNETKKLNIDNVYALVEQDSGSYNGLIKLGYTVQDKYHLFSTN